MTITAPAGLITIIRQKTSRDAPPGIKALIEEILARHRDAAQAILWYGSCFRKGDDSNGIVDFYLVVDKYRHAYRRHSYAFLNKLLPPNVFYFEIPYEEGVRRCKYTVFSFRDFQQGATMHWFRSYLWSRLAQPMGLVYARNNHVAEQVYTTMAQSLLTFITRVLPLMPPQQFTSRELWCTGIALSYAAELRAERRDKLTDLFDAAPRYYEELTRAAMDTVSYSVEAMSGNHAWRYRTSIPALTRISSRVMWALRRLQGKTLSILLLVKGLYTFQGGLDYVLWKIERHSGVRIQIDHRLRQIPLVGVVVLFWRLYRRGAFR
jgi:Mitochondrial matrix Mmp37.